MVTPFKAITSAVREEIGQVQAISPDMIKSL